MGRVAASWSQGKVDVGEASKIGRSKENQAREKKIVECVECRKPGKHGGYGMCRRCYSTWKREQDIGHCDNCNSPRLLPLYKVTSPTKCHTCYERERRQKLTPEERRQINRHNYEHHKAITPIEERRRIKNARELKADELTPDELEQVRAYNRARAMRRRHPELDLPLPPYPRIASRRRDAGIVGKSRGKPQVRRKYAKRVTPEEAKVFGGAIASLREEIRPPKVYRRRKAA